MLKGDGDRLTRREGDADHLSRGVPHGRASCRDLGASGRVPRPDVEPNTRRPPLSDRGVAPVRGIEDPCISVQAAARTSDDQVRRLGHPDQGLGAAGVQPEEDVPEVLGLGQVEPVGDVRVLARDLDVELAQLLADVARRGPEADADVAHAGGEARHQHVGRGHHLVGDGPGPHVPVEDVARGLDEGQGLLEAHLVVRDLSSSIAHSSPPRPPRAAVVQVVYPGRAEVREPVQILHRPRGVGRAWTEAAPPVVGAMAVLAVPVTLATLGYAGPKARPDSLGSVVPVAVTGQPLPPADGAPLYVTALLVWLFGQHMTVRAPRLGVHAATSDARRAWRTALRHAA